MRFVCDYDDPDLERISIKDIEFEIVEGHQGTMWFVPVNIKNKADYIHVHVPTDSRGYGGGTLTFNIRFKGPIQVKGPWHSNSDALFSETGVDVRETCLTFVVISRTRKYDLKKHTYIMQDVIYKDDKPEIGLFDRGEIMAQELVRLYGSVGLYVKSSGGSSNSHIE